MKGVEVAVETVRFPKKRRLETLIKETDQSFHQEIDEEALDHSKNLKGVKRMFETAEYLLEMKQARKSRKEDFILKERPKSLGEGSGMAREVPDGPSGSFSSSSSESDDEIKDISSDDERSEADDMEKVDEADAEKADDSKKAEYKKDVEEHDMDKQASEEQPIDEQAKINQPDKVQAERSVPKPQVEKPAATLISSKLVKAEIQSIVEVQFLQEKLADQRLPLVDTTVTMLLGKTTQPLQLRRKIKVLLKKSKKPEAQAGTNVILKRLTKLETKVEAMSKFNLPEAIDRFVQAHLRKNLPKDVPHFGKIKQEKAAKQSMPKYSTKPFDEASLKEYDQKDKLIKLMIKSKSYNTHPAHMKLYDALMDSLCHDDQDPSTDADKETKKRKRKDSSASSLKESKNKEESSKDDDMAADVMPHDDSPTQDKSKWFKQDVVVEPETLDPEWCKEPNADDAPELNWFNEMVNAEKDPLTFDDLMGSTVDFTKFAKHCL
ncbi:hypothetical protein Tco_1262424 [Tanacetum coccineum]